MKDNRDTKDSKDTKETKEASLTEALKKVFTAGVSGALLSEELLKSYLADLKLPKELLQIVLQSAQKSKDELGNKIGRELQSVLSKVDWYELGAKFLENHKVNIKMELSFTKKNDEP